MQTSFWSKVAMKVPWNRSSVQNGKLDALKFFVAKFKTCILSGIPWKEHTHKFYVE